jgi:hypothetical protein
MSRNTRYGSTPTRCTNEKILIIPTLYFHRSDLYSKCHAANNLSKENPQNPMTISHVYNNIQLHIEIIHTF